MDSELVRNDKIQWQLFARKTFGTIVFERIEHTYRWDSEEEEEVEETTRFYGYCYEKGAPEKERPLY